MSNERIKRNLFLVLGCLALTAPLAAQVPEGWNHRTALGSDAPPFGDWYGAGLWAGDNHGPAANLNDSLGLGNALTGSGMHLEAGYKGRRWDFAAEWLGGVKPDGGSFGILYRSHAWYRGTSGWQGGFEQEPLVWGYGLNGGYLLGEAARPFPRFRIESPMTPLHLGGIPLGTWGFQAFMGKLESDRSLSTSIQDASVRSRMLAASGQPEAPFFNGYRLQATFGSRMEFYLNLTDLWGGTLNGVGMTQGYNLGDYLTAMTGFKDTLAEASTDFSKPNPDVVNPYRNKARSASAIDVGFRLKTLFLAQAFGAENAWFYISRGSKSVIWPVGLFVKRPLYYLGQDVQHDWDHLKDRNLGVAWNDHDRYAVPNLGSPNDAVGILLAWNGIRFGLEYFAPLNYGNNGHRPFEHGQYLSGFYYHGDPLGSAVEGEGNYTTLKLEADISPRLSTTTIVKIIQHPFKDTLADWALDNPGQTAVKNRALGLQQDLNWKVRKNMTLSMGASWQRQNAVDYVEGRTGNGFRYFMDLAYRWPAKP